MGDHVEVYELVDHSCLLTQAHTEKEEEQEVGQSTFSLSQSSSAAQWRTGELADLPGREDDNGFEAGLVGGVDIQHEVKLEQGDDVGCAGAGEGQLHPQQFAETRSERQQREGVKPTEISKQRRQDNQLVVTARAVHQITEFSKSQSQQLHNRHNRSDDHVLKQVEPAQQPQQQELIDHQRSIIPRVRVGAKHMGGEQREDDEIAYCVPVVSKPLGVGMVVLELDVAISLLPLYQFFQVLAQLGADHWSPALATLYHYCFLADDQSFLAIGVSLEWEQQRRSNESHKHDYGLFRNKQHLTTPLNFSNQTTPIPPALIITARNAFHPLPKQLKLRFRVENQCGLAVFMPLPMDESRAAWTQLGLIPLWTIQFIAYIATTESIPCIWLGTSGDVGGRFGRDIAGCTLLIEGRVFLADLR